ncbi:MAG: hypothetical protein JNJ57_02135 [Saprospiraceae bacterium]|nr:hypothetical protein [Saprospiraceae bacterium]
MKSLFLITSILATFTSVSLAQDILGGVEDKQSFIFESASFVNPDDCERLTVKCNFPENLTEFEFSSADTQLAYSWGKLARPEKTFPMTLYARPGKVKVSYRVKGAEWKFIHFEVVKGNENTLTLNGVQGVNLN